MATRHKLGSFWVDTGTVLVGDPCQFIQDRDDPPSHLDYTSFVESFLAQGQPYTVPPVLVQGVEVFPAQETRSHAQFITVPSRNGGTAGLAVQVGCDGWYPVYAVKNKHGEILRIIIECGGQVTP